LRTYIYFKKYIDRYLKTFLLFIIFFVILSFNAYSLPDIVYDTGVLIDSRIELTNTSIGDSNNYKVEDNNLLDVITRNDFLVYFNNIDFRNYNYNVSTFDYNYLDNNSLYFDLDNSTIKFGSIINYDLDYNITYFNVLDDVYYLVDNNVLNIYSIEDNNLVLLSRIDTNDNIYSVATQDLNEQRYLFIANNGNGIKIYDITDNNLEDINAGYLGQLRYNYGGGDYNTSYLDSLTLENGLRYIVASQGTDFFIAVTFYKVSDLINLSGTLGNNDIVNLAEPLSNVGRWWFDSDYNSIYIPYITENKTHKMVYLYNLDDVNIHSTSLKNILYFNLFSFSSRIFSLSSDGNGISSFDLDNNFRNNFENSFSLLSSIDLNTHIFSLSSNPDINRIYALTTQEIIVLDYNLVTDSFVFIKRIYDINTCKEEGFGHQSFFYNSEKDAIFLGQENRFSFLPSQPLSLLGLDYNVVTYVYTSPVNNPPGNGTNNTGNNSSRGSGSGGTINQTTNNLDYNDYKDILLLLKKEYIFNKNQFSSYLLTLPFIDFTLRDSNYLLDYNRIIKDIDSLPVLKIINNEEIKEEIDKDKLAFLLGDYKLGGKARKYLTTIEVNDRNKLATYYFIEVLKDSNLLIIDYIPSPPLFSTSNLEPFISSFYLIKEDVNYLLVNKDEVYSSIVLEEKGKVVNNPTIQEEKGDEVIETKDSKRTIILFILILATIFVLLLLKGIKQRRKKSKYF